MPAPRVDQLRTQVAEYDPTQSNLPDASEYESEISVASIPAITILGLLYTLHYNNMTGVLASTSILIMLCGLNFIEPLFDRWADWFLRHSEPEETRICYYGTCLGALCSLLLIGNGHRYIFLLAEMAATIALGYFLGFLVFASLFWMSLKGEAFKETLVFLLISTVVILVTVYD